MDNAGINLSPFWRKFSIIIPIIAVFITAIVSLITNFYSDKNTIKDKVKEHDRIIQDRVITQKKPSFFIREFITYGTNQEIGSLYSEELLKYMFESEDNSFTIIQRQKLSSEEFGEGFIPFCNLMGATHIIEGRVHQEATLISIRLYSCISNSIILIKSFNVTSGSEYSKDSLKELQPIAQSIVLTAKKEVEDSVR